MLNRPFPGECVGGRQRSSLSQGYLAHGQGPRHHLTLSIIYWEAPWSCSEIFADTDSFDIKERVVDEAIGPLAVGRRQVNDLFSFQGTLELSVLLGDLVPQSRDRLILYLLQEDLLLQW